MKLLFPSEIAAMDREEAEREIRARVQTVSISDDIVLTRVLGCPKMYLSKSDHGFAHHVMLDGHWELWLTLFMARKVTPGMKAIDVGANFGYYSLLLGLAVGATGKVAAVEPNPRIAEILARSINLNGLHWVKLFEKAVGAIDEQILTMFQPKNEPKNTAVVPDNWPSDEGAVFRVPSTTVDAIADELGGVDFIKIDAEGAEIAIVDGMKKTIEYYKPNIVLEFNAARYSDPEGFLSKFKGYKSPRAIDYHGDLIKISEKDIIETDYGQDKLVYFEKY
ncbi:MULTISPECIES: FkbM family methyltransferase [unclassified Beijerinckia]|uniref:FkbM family methyltransferase n=1 Tax=unclassified Beijerinckia TaxID=2638183 RepID=UPI000895BCE8|nr:MULTISPECIES: FkbM family methyltransferase [unclassified Beijerinckia]MDH7797006.1 FkbM family methyltransferase [Beijerinckia sp. GAS462]SEC68365.1 methyltransferase, FkbM family [Beijerinckia sp. 28-YEA-48]